MTSAAGKNSTAISAAKSQGALATCDFSFDEAVFAQYRKARERRGVRMFGGAVCALAAVFDALAAVIVAHEQSAQVTVFIVIAALATATGLWLTVTGWLPVRTPRSAMYTAFTRCGTNVKEQRPWRFRANVIVRASGIDSAFNTDETAPFPSRTVHRPQGRTGTHCRNPRPARHPHEG